MDEQRQNDQLEYSSSVPVQDVALKTCRERWTIETCGERGSGRFVLAAWHDDDDDDEIGILETMQNSYERTIWKMWIWTLFPNLHPTQVDMPLKTIYQSVFFLMKQSIIFYKFLLVFSLIFFYFLLLFFAIPSLKVLQIKNSTYQKNIKGDFLIVRQWQWKVKTQISI